MHKNILLMGRGNSIRKIKSLKEKYDLVVIVNNFKNEIKNLEVFDFLKSQKKVIQYVGRDKQSLMKKETYDLLDVEEVVLNVFHDEYYGIGPYNRSASKSYLDRLNINNRHLSKNIKQYSLDPNNKENLRQPSFPTTGILAFVDLCVNQKPRAITTIGIDFYKTPYFAEHVITGNKNPTEGQIKKGLKMIEYLNLFTENFCKANNIEVKIINDE